MIKIKESKNMNDIAKMFSYKKGADDEEREVYLKEDGSHVGTIMKSWNRVGGEGWALAPNSQTYRTMKDAAWILYTRSK